MNIYPNTCKFEYTHTEMQHNAAIKQQTLQHLFNNSNRGAANSSWH